MAEGSGFWGELIGAAGDAYGDYASGERASDERKASDRAKQRELTETRRSVWLWLGVAGAVAIIITVIALVFKKV